MSAKQLRVLQVVPSLSRAAGVARFVYNMERYHDEKRVHYDFMHHAIRDGVYMHKKRYDEELKARGCFIYPVNYAGDDLRRFMREVHEVFEKVGSNYDIVHCHMPNSAFCVLREAEQAGIQHRVLHSHLNNSSDKFLHRLRNMPLNAIGKHYATDRIACSDDAGRFLFGSKPFTVINNGIPLEGFAYDLESRTRLRIELGIGETDPVVGCVGRFVKQKNFPFAIRVFAKFNEAFPDAKMLILGDGDDREELEKIIVSEHLSDAVILAGVREDVNKLYSVMDVFFMPSLYEGLPVSAVEAQAAGLPCVYSNKVPNETDITGTGAFVSLDNGVEQWANVLTAALNDGRLMENPILLERQGYSAKTNAELLMQHYEQLIAER